MDLAVADRLRLHHIEGFPADLLDLPSGSLWHRLAGPTLFHVAGRHEPPLFVSVLLHGNEDTGWQAVQQVLKRHRPKRCTARCFYSSAISTRPKPTCARCPPRLTTTASGPARF